MAEKSGFIWYELMTNDLDKAVSFYTNVVGWDVRDSGMPGTRYMMFGKGGIDVGGMMSWSSVGTEKPAKWIGHIHTTDVDAETAATVAEGGKQYRPATDIPGVGRFSVVADPQGAEYMLFQPNLTEAPSRLKPAELGAVNWHELATSDWTAAWDFYSRHYGWTKDVAVDMGPMGTYQTFSQDDTVAGGGMMNLPPGSGTAAPGPSWKFYFTVEDINGAVEKIKANGGTVLHGPVQVPGGSWTVQALDSQGGAFAITAKR